MTARSWSVAGAVAVATVLSTACMSPRISMPAPVADPSAQAGGTCNEKSARFLLGKTVDERIAEDARVRSGARVVRVLRPGVAHDDEKRDARLNVEVDGLGQALAVRCG